MKHNKLMLLDFFKGFSIFAIILYHLIDNFSNFPGILKTLSSYGGAGVHIFFICSGFGLFYSYLKNGFDLIDYISKRFKKVYIPYVIIILLSACFPFMYSNSDKIVALFSHILLFKMFISKYQMTFGIQMWYVSTIFQFYIVFPILLKILKRINIQKLFVISIFISLGYATFLSIFELNSNLALNYLFLQYIWEFVLGMYICHLFVNKKINTFKKVKTIQLIGVFLVTFFIYGIMSIKGEFMKNYNDVFSAISFATLILILYRCKIFNGIMIFLGKYSYELYLIHYLVLSIVFYYLKFPFILNCIISLLLIMIISILFNKLLHIKYFSKKRSC